MEIWLNRLSNVISYLLHPLLMPCYSLIFLYNSNTYINYTTPGNIKLAIYITTFIFTFTLPLCVALFLRYSGFISSLQMPLKEERRLPYLATVFLFMMGYYTLNNLVPLPKPVTLALLAANISIVLTIIINYNWKISAHMVGIGGMLGMLMGLSYRLMVDMRMAIVFITLCAGFVAFARLQLNAHKPMQVYTGLLVGFFCEFLFLAGF